MILPYIGCFTRRSTRTTTVLSVLSDTTVPVRTRFGICCSLSLDGGGTGPLALKRPDLGDGAAHLADPGRLLDLVGRGLEAQVELLALQLRQLLDELVVGAGFEIVDLRHLYASSSSDSPRRATTFVRIGSFSAARSNATVARWPGTPSSSKRMRPGLTRATQNSGEPLPEPMRTSAGFDDTGTSGKMRIHKRPWRLMWRVIARRAASIWRAVIRSGSIALRPNAPKLSSVPPLALPWMRPLKALRNLVRLGCSISYVLPLTGCRALHAPGGLRRSEPPS